MTDIRTYLTDDHRACDEVFAKMEESASKGSAKDAAETFNAFAGSMEHHFQMEERVLFPEFEQKTGMTQGPTQVMRMEHEQMRRLIGDMSAAVEADDTNRFFGLSETLMILIQQHNMKEEQMLYTMIQQHMSAENDQIMMLMESMITQ